MSSLNHTHTYERWLIKRKDKMIKGERAFKCKDPDCSHFTRESLVKGKRSLCTSCGTPFIIDEYTLKTHSQLKCINCRNTREARELKVVNSLMDEALAKYLPKAEEDIEHETFGTYDEQLD